MLFVGETHPVAATVANEGPIVMCSCPGPAQPAVIMQTIIAAAVSHGFCFIILSHPYVAGSLYVCLPSGGYSINLMRASLLPMNIHHLELFYYVARYEGISEAVRQIPYGIQQPAVSGQVAQLEEHLGVTLFHRRPFALTAQGESLYEFIEPFFSGLAGVATRLQGGQVRHIRVGASTQILRDHLPGLFQDVSKRYPGLKIAVREVRRHN